MNHHNLLLKLRHLRSQLKRILGRAAQSGAASESLLSSFIVLILVIPDGNLDPSQKNKKTKKNAWPEHGSVALTLISDLISQGSFLK